MIEYITKDVTTVERGVVAHGVNCQGKMGSGVAKAIRARWPIVFERYEPICNNIDRKSDLLGLAHIVNVGECVNGLFVANCFTQFYYGNDGKRYADVQAVRESLESAIDFALGADLPLYMVKIGCKLGGLDWETEVKPVVETLYQNVVDRGRDLDIYICDI